MTRENLLLMEPSSAIIPALLKACKSGFAVGLTQAISPAILSSALLGTVLTVSKRTVGRLMIPAEGNPPAESPERAG